MSIRHSHIIMSGSLFSSEPCGLGFVLSEKCSGDAMI